ncbi:MAG: hypothetical protein R2828_01690 [Saprospiraceae bacterium]
MQKLILTLSISGILHVFLLAQNGLEGSWEGWITHGGIHSTAGYKFELVLTRTGKNGLKGRSFIYLAPDKVIEMDIGGILYGDQSIYLEDVFFRPTEGKETTPPYDRKYQLIFNRSIWDSSLEGYWQEKRTDPFFPMRSRGRITLKRKKTSGA